MSRLDSVGLAKQTALGTKNVTPEYTIPVETAEGGINRETIEREETTGTKFPSDIEYGSRFFEVALAGDIRLNSGPRLASGFFGAPTTTTPAGGTTSKQHLFNPVGKTLVPHSILANRTDPSPAITDLFWDALGNEITFSVEPNGRFAYEASYIARALDDTLAEPTPTYDASARFPFHQVKAYVSIDGGGETTLDCSAFSVTYTNNIDTDQVVLGSQDLFKVQEGNVDAEVTFTVKSALATWYRRVLQTDPAQIKIRIEALGSIIESTIKRKFEALVYRCQAIEGPADIDAGDTLDDIEITAHASYDSTASKFCDLTFVNTVATY